MDSYAPEDSKNQTNATSNSNSPLERDKEGHNESVEISAFEWTAMQENMRELMKTSETLKIDMNNSNAANQVLQAELKDELKDTKQKLIMKESQIRELNVQCTTIHAKLSELEPLCTISQETIQYLRGEITKALNYSQNYESDMALMRDQIAKAHNNNTSQNHEIDMEQLKDISAEWRIVLHAALESQETLSDKIGTSLDDLTAALDNYKLTQGNSFQSPHEKEMDAPPPVTMQKEKEKDSMMEEQEFTIHQLKATLEIVSHMATQAVELTIQEREKYRKTINELERKLQKYEIEIAKKYAILR